MRTTLLVCLALALGGGAARADNPDWSQYIDHDAKPTPAADSTQVASATPAKSKAKAKPAKKVASKTKSKAKARRKY